MKSANKVGLIERRAKCKDDHSAKCQLPLKKYEPVNRNAMGLKNVGVHRCHNVMQKVGLAAEKLLGRFPHDNFGLFCELGRDSVPRFGLSPMQIVNRGSPVVLRVPTKRREAHAHVEPGNFHAADVNVDVFQD